MGMAVTMIRPRVTRELETLIIKPRRRSGELSRPAKSLKPIPFFTEIPL